MPPSTDPSVMTRQDAFAEIARRAESDGMIVYSHDTPDAAAIVSILRSEKQPDFCVAVSISGREALTPDLIDDRYKRAMDLWREHASKH